MIKISNGILALSVDEKGAQMRSLIDECTGREYLWQADPAIWGRTAPILFPAVGKMYKDSYLHGGKSYPMPKHGFLRDAEFAPEILSEDYLVLAYSPDEKIKESYPFDFEFLAKFALDGSALVFAYDMLGDSHGGLIHVRYPHIRAHAQLFIYLLRAMPINIFFAKSKRYKTTKVRIHKN